MAWEPEEYESDPMVNAILNVARQLHGLTMAAQSIADRVGRDDTVTVAEAPVVAGREVGESLERAARTVADAIEGLASAALEGVQGA